jgi:hypothetical protein
MASQIRFKFKGAGASDTDILLFEGVGLPLEAFKRAVIAKRHLGASGADLIVEDAAGSGAPRAIVSRGGLL